MFFSGVIAYLLKILCYVAFTCGITFFAISSTGTLFSSITFGVSLLLTPISTFLLFNSTVFSPLSTFMPNLKLEEFFYKYAYLIALTVGLITLCFGVLIFTKRKSEIAGKSSLTKLSQLLFRLFITAPVLCLVANIALVAIINGDFYYLIFAFFFLILALLVWFFFELITKKGLRAAFASLKTAPLMLAVLLILTVSPILTRNVILGVTPKANDVASVSIRNDGGTRSIFIINASRITYTDEASKQIFCDVMKKETKKAYPVDSFIFSNDKTVYSSSNVYYYEEKCTVVLTLKNGNTYERALPMWSILPSLAESTEHGDEIFTLPTSLYYSAYVSHLSYDELPLFSVFADEFNSLPVLERLKLISGSPYSDSTSFNFGYFSISQTDHSQVIRIGIPISFVNTRKAFIESSLATQGEEGVKDISSLPSKLSDGHSVKVYFTRADGTDTSAYLSMMFLNTYLGNYISELCSVVAADPLATREFDISKQYIIIFHHPNDSDITNCIVNITEETEKKIDDIIQRYRDKYYELTGPNG